jgi:hypothetical protein
MDSVINLIDSSLIGKRMSVMCRKYSLSEGDYHVINEPPEIARGLYFQSGGGAIINFYIERAAGFRNKPKRLLRKRITGVAYADALCKNEKYFGKGMPWFGIIFHDCE